MSDNDNYNLENIKSQIRHRPKKGYHCCGKKYASRSLFKKHLMECHSVDYKNVYRQMFKNRLRNKEHKFRYIELLNKEKDYFELDTPPYYICSRCGNIISKGVIFKSTNIGEVHVCPSCAYWLTTPKERKVRIVYNATESSRRRH